MDGKKDNRAMDSNNLKDHDVKLGETFEDPRLDKLWNKVSHDLLKLTSKKTMVSFIDQVDQMSLTYHTESCCRKMFSLYVIRSLFQAKTSGKFSEEELQSLRKEFEHHKDKIHEYNIVMDTVSRTEGELNINRTLQKQQKVSWNV